MLFGTTTDALQFGELLFDTFFTQNDWSDTLVGNRVYGFAE